MTPSVRVLVCACVLIVMMTSSTSARAQFNLFPSNWNSGTGNEPLYPPAAIDESNALPNSRCRTLLDIGTHGSPDCPKDFDHQIFDTHLCRFVCLPSDPSHKRASLYDQNGVLAGEKPRTGLGLV